jgi:hypothetical protein
MSPTRPAVTRSLFVLAAGIALYCVLWAASAALLHSEIDDWIDAQRAEGARIVHGEALLGGFPARVVVTLPSWQATVPLADGEAVWRTDRVQVWARPWRPFRFTVDLGGGHSVGGFQALIGATTWIALDRAELVPVLTAQGRLGAFTLDVSGASLAPAAGAPASAMLDTLAAVVEPKTAADDEPAWNFVLKVAGLRLGEDVPTGPFDRGLRQLIVRADLIGPVRPGSLRESLEAWRQAGGTLNLRELTFDWPPLFVAGSATLALDERLQPMGAGTIKFRGFFETVDRMVEIELVRPSAASMARIALGLLSRTPEDGGPSELSIGVTIQDGKLSAGPVPLMDVPVIEWDELR